MVLFLRQFATQLLLPLGACVALAAQAEQGEYLRVEDFLNEAIPAANAEADVLWISPALRAEIESVVERPYSLARVRYWHGAGRTAWVFDEIGKEEPITIGISVQAGHIERVRILAFRESRGWEVRMPFFTEQFSGVARDPGQAGLDRSIDGITGATLSVRAVNRVAKLALLLDEYTAAERARVEVAATP